MCCRGNRYDVISAFKVLPNNRVAKIFIVCLHYELLSFFGILHRFTNTIAIKKTLSSLLKAQLVSAPGDTDIVRSDSNTAEVLNFLGFHTQLHK